MIRLNQRLPNPNNSLCLTQQELMVTSIGCFISHSFPFPKSLVDSFLPPPSLLRLQFCLTNCECAVCLYRYLSLCLTLHFFVHSD